MNVVRKSSNTSETEIPKLIDINSLSDVKKQTYKVLEYIEEVTGKEVLDYIEPIGNNLESIISDKVLGQQDYFRFTIGYLLRNDVKVSLQYNEYDTYILEKNKESLRKEKQSNKLALTKSLQKKDLLYEALAPIHNRLMQIKSFFDKLARYDKLAAQTKFNNIYNSKISVIDAISKQLISDKGDLTKLEEDAKYMRAEEKLIMDAAKKSYTLYMLQIYKSPAVINKKQLSSNEVKQLFNQGSTQTLTYSDYQGLQSLFEETVKNSEDFWIFHEKFFNILVRLGLREERRKKKR